MSEENNIVEDEEYKCSKCGTFTVSMSYEWGVWDTDRGEECAPMYVCKKCGEDAHIRECLNDYKPGDTIDM